MRGKAVAIVSTRGIGWKHLDLFDESLIFNQKALCRKRNFPFSAYFQLIELIIIEIKLMIAPQWYNKNLHLVTTIIKIIGLDFVNIFG